VRFGVAKYRGFLLTATFASLIEFLMGLSDSVVSGHILGESALAAVNLLQPPMNVVSFFACLLGTGTAIRFSFEIGRFDRARANAFFSQGLWGAMTTGGALALTFLLGRDLFLSLFDAAPAVTELARTYWTWFIPCAFLEPVAVLLANACYADGDGRLCTLSYGAQLLGNVGFSFVLTRWMGIGGCALGTVLGNLAAIAVLACHFRRVSNTLAVRRHFRFGDLAAICRSSFGDASSRLCQAVLFFVFTKYVLDRFGAPALPVASVVIAVLGFTEAFNGMPNAAQPLVGVYIGERNYLGVRTVMRAAGATSVWVGLGLSALFAAVPQLVTGLVGIGDPAILGDACAAVRWTACGLLFWAILSLFNSYYLFIDREGLACALTALGNLAMPLALFPAAGALFGRTGVWAAFCVAPAASVAVFAAFLALRYGRDRLPLLLPRDRDAGLRTFDLVLDEARICAVAEQIENLLASRGVSSRIAGRVSILTEEVLMAVKDRNGGRRVLAEATLDLNEGVSLVLRDDGEIFDITDVDARISSLRSYLVASIMEAQPNRRNLTTTGFNRNVFRF